MVRVSLCLFLALPLAAASAAAVPEDATALIQGGWTLEQQKKIEAQKVQDAKDLTETEEAIKHLEHNKNSEDSKVERLQQEMKSAAAPLPTAQAALAKAKENEEKMAMNVAKAIVVAKRAADELNAAYLKIAMLKAPPGSKMAANKKWTAAKAALEPPQANLQAVHEVATEHAQNLYRKEAAGRRAEQARMLAAAKQRAMTSGGEVGAAVANVAKSIKALTQSSQNVAAINGYVGAVMANAAKASLLQTSTDCDDYDNMPDCAADSRCEWPTEENPADEKCITTADEGSLLRRANALKAT